jgi:GNAT superfamily N-acetyltransferase
VTEEIRITSESSRSDLARRLLQRYYHELALRFPNGFEPGHAAVAQLHEYAPPGGIFLVAFLSDAPIGCGALRRFDDNTAEVKRMWVDPVARGRGVGRGLLRELEASGVALGYQRLCLDTSAHLPEAVALYRSAGFDEVPDYNNNPEAAFWFRRDIR